LAQKALSFRELNRRSDPLVQILLGWGIQKGDRMAIFAPNGWKYFGILRRPKGQRRDLASKPSSSGLGISLGAK